MRFTTADTAKYAVYAAVGVVTVGTYLRDHAQDKRLERVERKLDAIERQTDYVTDRVRDADPDYPPEDW